MFFHRTVALPICLSMPYLEFEFRINVLYVPVLFSKWFLFYVFKIHVHFTIDAVYDNLCLTYIISQFRCFALLVS